MRAMARYNCAHNHDLRSLQAARVHAMGRPLYPPEHYASRVARALEYIERNLGQRILLPVLADQAAFSPYHFHRVFCEWQGETPQAYIRRQRLERSAALLHYGAGNAVAQVALQCGFTSVQAFDRAFRTYFGTTPTQWRSGAFASWRQDGDTAIAPLPALTPDLVRIADLPAVETVYSRKLGPYQTDQEAHWERFAGQAAAMGLSGQICFGVGLDDPAVTPAARCRYDLCMALPVGVPVPRHTPVKLLPGGDHALLSYTGLVGQTGPYWQWLFQTWLPQSGYMVSQHACFERYPHGIPTSGIVSSELCLPLARALRRRKR